MAAIPLMQACRHSQDELLKFKLGIRMSKKGDLRDLDGC